MNVNTSVASLKDSIIEMVCMKSGLLISSGDFVSLLERELSRGDENNWWYSPREWLHNPPASWVRIRPENIESIVVRLMYAIGSLPDPLTEVQLVDAFARDNPRAVGDLEPMDHEADFPLPVTPGLRLSWYLQEWKNSPSSVPTAMRDLCSRL